MGIMLAKGIGTEKNYSEALDWFRKGAKQWKSSAQKNLGNLFYYGYGTKKDWSEALVWYRKAAEQGDLDAQVSLGRMFYNGDGIDNYSEAFV
jgi:TPR repeat protein